MDGDKRAKYERDNHDSIQYCEYSGQELRFVSALDDFIRSVEVMQQTVLFPSVLMDLTVNSLLPNIVLDEIYITEETDLRTFCLMVRSLKTQLTEGCNYIEEGMQENIQRREKVQELCKQLRPLIRQAKYLGYAAEEIALCSKPVRSFQEFTKHESEHAFLYDDHSTCNLRATVRMFLHEVGEMEEEIPFPSLLKSHTAVDYGCSSDKEQTLNDLYVSLLQFKSILLNSQGIHLDSLENSSFGQIVSKLKSVFYNYTTILDKLIVLYLQKVDEDI